ncbi:SRPBCC family protein [Patulibacter minatonensis]|uniref:SRPBCC family protein n=1 Tax=Patulibacter minatonensis TaxID=298163 RepID=UPI00047E3D9F|nr:SRPBCC family protein [Patulibacter minatonensis]
MTDRGTYVEHEGRPAVRFRREYPHPVDRVWAAVTRPDELVRWFPSSVAFEEQEGGAIRFADDPHMESTAGMVLTWDPPRAFAFTWGPDEVHLTLEALPDGGTRLTLLNVLDARDAAARNAGGWHVCLLCLDHHLEGGTTFSPHEHPPAAWQPVYDAYVADGLPSGAPVPEVG